MKSCNRLLMASKPLFIFCQCCCMLISHLSSTIIHTSPKIPCLHCSFFNFSFFSQSKDSFIPSPSFFPSQLREFVMSFFLQLCRYMFLFLFSLFLFLLPIRTFFFLLLLTMEGRKQEELHDRRKFSHVTTRWTGESCSS